MGSCQITVKAQYEPTRLLWALYGLSIQRLSRPICNFYQFEGFRVRGPARRARLLLLKASSGMMNELVVFWRMLER